MLDSKGFDLWADDYDKSVNISEDNNEYPFAGYKEVLNYIYNQVRETDHAKVLDIGFGTAVLTTRLYQSGCDITGIDFSKNMIDIAKHKMPEATLFRLDITNGIPAHMKDMRYDYIVSTYAIHHLSEVEKIKFITSLSYLLKESGKIIIGDVSFRTREELEICKTKYTDCWDEDEIYLIVDEMADYLNDNYNLEFIQIAHCSGILIITNKEE